MKKRLFPLFLALLLLLSACGASVGNSASAAAGDSGSMPGDMNGWTEEASADTAESGADFSAVRKNAKLILNANLTLETQDFDKASADIEKMAADAGGYLESSSLSGDAGSRHASYVLRIPQEKFEAFYEQLGSSVHVVYSSRSSEDVTEQYTDIETRLATLTTKHERLLALLDQADKMEDIINRGGGNVLIRVYNSTEDGQFADTDVTVNCDGREFTVPAGTQVRLQPGESITVYPYMYHDFELEPGTGPVLLGEVSMCNDDENDNRFYEPIGRFPEIEEDEPPYRLLCTEYPRAEG